jgi:PAS domain S-box-containing protein
MSRSTSKQLQYIQDFLIGLAAGDFNAKLSLAEDDDEQIKSIEVGINMLVEELKITTISQVFLNSIYNGINDILIVLNEKGEVQKTNSVLEKLLLYNEQELKNKSVEKLIHLDCIDDARNAIKNAYETAEIKEIGLNFIDKNKSTIPVSCSFSVLYNAQNQPSGILLVAKDIRVLLNAKEQLEEKNDELNLFVYKASHDLKGPIASMLGVLELSNKSEVKLEEETKMYIHMIEECAFKLNTILNDLLVLGRITYGNLEYEDVNIKKMVTGILKSIEYAKGFSDVDIKVDVSAEQSIITEKELLHTIILNLIDNGIKYRKLDADRGYIYISAKPQDSGICITVEDHGIGIDELAQKDIFKMFYRATYQSKGSGLGLYIVKTSVLKLGGTISFESVLEKGTSFKIYIPSK